MGSSVHLLLVPGAWMGAWIWEPTVERLRARGLGTSTLTLSGLGDDDAERASGIRLEDHVREVMETAADLPGDLVLVSHSYSAMVTGQVADRLADRIVGLVHIGGFLPTNGRSLLDELGLSEDEREQEARTIHEAGNLWLAPTLTMLEMEPDLSASDVDTLMTQFRAHPGSTITDPARLRAPVADQPTTYVALSVRGHEAAWQAAPRPARLANGWRKKTIASGHWPMLTRADELVDLLVEEAHWYSR